MTARVELDPRDYAHLLMVLRELPRRVGLKVLRIALNAWGGVVKSAAQSRVRKQTGLLGKSLRVKVKIPDASFNVAHHGRPAYVLVGPSRHVVGPAARVNGRVKLLSIRKATKRVLGGGKVQTRRPSRYAHLVERGHLPNTPAYPFIGPAQKVGETAGMAKLKEKLSQGIAAEGRALANR